MSFTSFFKQGRPVLSFEFFPPKQAQALPQLKELMKSLLTCSPDFMTVTYGAGGGTRDFTLELVGYIAADLRVPAVAHLTCVGHSKAEIDAVLDQCRDAGISHVLALRGDPPKDQPEFQPHPEGFHNARDLARHIKSRGAFSVAVAGYPEVHREAHSPEAELAYLREKVDAGAEVIITQLFFDAQVYFTFCERAKRIGITVPIVPGIMPVGNVAQVKRFTDMCGATIPPKMRAELDKLEHDPEGVIRYGIDYAHQMCQALINGGAPGLHFYTLNRGNQVQQIVGRLCSMPQFERPASRAG